MSSLAAQLAQNASLNAPLLVDRSRRKPSASYLFTGKDADQHDLEAIHALGVNALLNLCAVDKKLRKFEDYLFSEHAKETDRTLLTREAAEELDDKIEGLLLHLGPYLMEAPTGKVIEWLVRRFRIHEFNVEAVISLFLPYHETPHFTKMVTLLQIKPNSTWSFLIPYKSAAQKLPRVSLVTEMLKNSDVARFVTSLHPRCIKKNLSHRVILAFNVATLHDFIKRVKSVDEGTIAYLLPALLEPLQQKTKKMSKDAVLGSYILLASLSQKCKLGSSALKVIVGTMSSAAHVVRGDHFVNSLVALCEPQEELEGFTNDTINAILLLSNIEDTLASTPSWTGSEKVLCPLSRGFCSRLTNEVSQRALESTIATSTVPVSVIETMTRILVRTAVENPAEPQDVSSARRLLSLIYQRYPLVLREAVDWLSEEDLALKEALDQLVISLSTARPIPILLSIIKASSQASQREGSDIILSCSNADPKVRTAAVKQLIQSIAGKELHDIEDLETVRSVLIARHQDTEIAVLEALYENFSVLTPMVTSDTGSYIASLSAAITSEAKPKRNALRLHLTYLASQIWTAAELSAQADIFHRILFPFLLFTKSRQKTAELVWDIIGQHLSKSAASTVLEWLVGCAGLVKAEMAAAEGVDSTELMNQVNFKVSEKIAENILNSAEFPTYFDAVILKLQDENSHVKLLAYLIVLALVQKGSGERQSEIAHRVMSAMAVEQLLGVDDLSQEHLTLGSPETYSKYIITKPNGKTALHWLQISMIAAIAQIQKPAAFVLDWLSASSNESMDRGKRHVSLMRSIYQIANASTALPILSSTILQFLFVNLQTDALAFLAGIWTSDSSEFKDSRGISLLHAAAFLEAHNLEDDGTDFQTIIPALLVALQSSDPQVSGGALECISRIRILAERKLTSVYQFDVIYGQSEKTLQYLDSNDLKRYLTGLLEHGDHFVHDPSYLKVFNEHHLGRVKGDKKRDVEYKHRVVCYLLSHTNAFSSENAQNNLLKSLSTLNDKAKCQVILPTIQSAVEKVSSAEAAEVSASFSEEFMARILACFDASAADYLNNTATAWDIFLQVIHTFLRSGIPLLLQQAVAKSIESGLFSALNQHRQLAVAEALLDAGSANLSASLARNILSTTLTEVPLIVQLLDSLAPAASSSSPRAPKRIRTSESSTDALPRLSLLVEILGTKELPGSLDLVSRLLDVLNRVAQSQSSAQADVSFIEQLLMSAIESTASKITEVPNISPSVIRLDVLVEVIRVSDNPQTFNQALLLIAKLARLAPDSVLYNIMPVFTFMGSNVFHRDDSYSFKVVQQTIDGIVPVMVSSLKQSHAQSLDLYLASKEFLRIFTDAATHIPRHRRNNFFAHLVDVLGPHDFSAAVCMLLLDKSANRITRQSADDIQGSLALPISVFQHSSCKVQIHTATEVLNEAQRLILHIIDPKSTLPLFLEGISDGDHSLSSATILKRRAQTLIIFVGFALKANSSVPEEGDSFSSVIAQLIMLAAATPDAAAEHKLDEVYEAARSTLNRLLGSMSVIDFIASAQTMLRFNDIKVQSGALELLAKRLPEVSPKTRPVISDDVNRIMTLVKSLLSMHKKGRVVVDALYALKSIATTMCPGEESVMTELIPSILSASKDKDLAPPALAALSAISTKVGPRIIPFFRSIISQSVRYLRGSDTTLFEDAFSILHGLLASIPTFWGTSEVTQVVLLFIDHFSFSQSPLLAALTRLIKTLAKKTPAKVLLPALIDLWNPLQESKNAMRIAAYFEIFGRSLQHADRPTTLDHLRSAFNTFLEALDLVKLHDEAEGRVISAFKEMVIKLNESAFKPLFRRLYDWAFAGQLADVYRKVAFCRLYINLLDFFKGLMVPYMTFLLQATSDILKSSGGSSPDNFALWSSIVGILTRVLNYDDIGFWRDDRLRQISTGLTGQIEVCVRLNFADGKNQLQDCLGALLESITDDTLVKIVNLNVLMHTRSEDPRVRIFALSCSEALWRSQGGKLLGFVAETATFVAECSEDENDLVVKESFRLKDAVESVAGKIDGL